MESSSPSSEEARNRALLFFMDHLMTKSGSRTIHDLSCQFGARGFTDDMREAVGGTQEALTAFLQSYPSLFTIDGDEVSMKMYGDMTDTVSSAQTGKTRDYEEEAVQFFINKLKKFGPEMQIKSLLGHRSQAALECRMASGRHLKDFVDFLIKHSEAFVVAGDRVRLAVMPEPDDPALLLDENGETLSGARAKIAAVVYLKSYVESNDDNPIALDVLYSQFCQRFPHLVRQHVATNPKELLAFLKLNRQVFFIRSNKVSLVRTRSADQSSPSSQEGRLSTGWDSDVSQVSAQLASLAVLQKPQITSVKSLKQAQVCLQELLHENLVVNGRQIIAFDCKFVSLGPSTPDFLSLMVIGTPTGKLVVFDAAHSDAIVLESGVKQLLERDTITKVMHDCSNIADMLQTRYNISLCNVFDTQIAHQVYQHVRHGKPLAETRPISFINLQRMHHPQSLMQTANNPNVPRVQFNWGQRPINDDSLPYICEHGIALVPTLYLTLHNALTPEVMPLFSKLCAQRCELKEETFNESFNMNGRNSLRETQHDINHKICCSQCHRGPPRATISIGTQTISTGEITISNVAYE